MRNSLRLGRIAGIPIGLHWSVGLIGFVVTTTLAGSILPAAAPGLAGVSYTIAALATTGLFLSSIIAHELGHSIVAIRNGVGVKDITLFALGGVAQLENEPTTPGAAAKIALAGPAASLVVGLAALATAWAGGVIGLSALFVAALYWLGIINGILAVFNMIPALPLDGGRVLQSILWKLQGNQHQATISAATIGRYLGWGIVALGLWQFSVAGAGLWTIFIGFFVIGSARRAELHSRLELRRQEMATQPQPGFWNLGPPTAQPRPSYPRTDDDVIDVESREVDAPA